MTSETFALMNQNIFEHCREVYKALKIFIISFFICSVKLFRAEQYELILIFHIDMRRLGWQVYREVGALVCWVKSRVALMS